MGEGFHTSTMRHARLALHTAGQSLFPAEVPEQQAWRVGAAAYRAGAAERAQVRGARRASPGAACWPATCTCTLARARTWRPPWSRAAPPSTWLLSPPRRRCAGAPPFPNPSASCDALCQTLGVLLPGIGLSSACAVCMWCSPGARARSPSALPSPCLAARRDVPAPPAAPCGCRACLRAPRAGGGQRSHARSLTGILPAAARVQHHHVARARARAWHGQAWRSAGAPRVGVSCGVVNCVACFCQGRSSYSVTLRGVANLVRNPNPPLGVGMRQWTSVCSLRRAGTHGGAAGPALGCAQQRRARSLGSHAGLLCSAAWKCPGRLA